MSAFARFYPVVLLAAGLVAYGPLLFRAGPLDRDDTQLLRPLETVSTPAAWLEAWRSGQLLDVAPVRDLSFAADLSLSRSLPPTFTAVNLALWLAFAFLAVRLFRALGVGETTLVGLVVLLAAHPAYAVSVAWISSRKHLLAGVFLLAATLAEVRPPARFARAKSCAFYALSLLSHPIHLLWPFWAWARKSREHGARAAALALLPHFGVMAALGALNAWYYANLYPVASGGTGKFSGGVDPAAAALAFGRATFNLLLPVALTPADYAPWSWPGFAGLALLVALAAGLARTVERRELLEWALFAALPLALLNARATRMFFCDTYLLVPSLGAWILLARAAERFPGRLRRAGIALFVLAALGLAETRTLASSFASTETLFELAYRREPTPQVTAVHAKNLFEHGALREAAETAFSVIPEFPAAEGVFAQAVALDTRLTARQRLELLAKSPGREPVWHWFRAKVLLEAGDPAGAWAELKPALGNLRRFGAAAPAAAADLLRSAQAAGAWTPALEAAVRAELAAVPKEGTP